MIRKNILSLCLGIGLTLITASSWADSDNSNAGTSAFNFLKIEVTSRPVSMGGAFTGVADDESALYYNPAGFAALEGKRYVLGYHNNIFDMQSGFVGFIHPLSYRNDKAVAIFVDYLNYGDFIETNNLGEEIGIFGGSDILFGFGYAMSINEELHVGITSKLIYEKIDVYSSHGFAFDFGVKKTFNYDQTSVGLSIQNLGLQLSGFTEGAEKDPLPLRIRGGASTKLKGLPLLIAGDVIYPTDNDIYFAVGAELLNTEPLFLRFGWTSFGSNYKTGASNDNIGGFAAGFGLKYRKMQISYAVSPQAELGTSHRITINGGF
jgi:hypothetical protein